MVILALVASSINAGQWAEAEKLIHSPTLDFAQARQALTIYERLLPPDGQGPPQLLTRLAQVCFILGDLAEEKQRRQFYQSGRRYAESLLQARPEAVEGHYWLAMHLCGLADVGSMVQGRRLLPRILQELHRALALDETYDQAGAHRVLGRIYYEAPGWPFSVGDLDKSLRHLSAAVRLAPETSTNHLYLAETLLRLGKTAQAGQEFQAVLRSSRHAIHPPGLADDRRQAQRHLTELRVPDNW
ncbi:MAG: TRAP transporter TatT component family protein [Desulfobacca sp.]|nr:TRAP transporter TatT component family protein [Desulfobacca sp.]